MPRKRNLGLLIPRPDVHIQECGAKEPGLHAGKTCFQVRVQEEGGWHMIYHDYMKRWRPSPPWWKRLWRKVWSHVQKT
jgi:hypothetical protein